MNRGKLATWLARSPQEVRDLLRGELRRRLARNPLIWIDGPRGIVPLRWYAGQEEAWRRQAAVKVFGILAANRWGKSVWATRRVAQTALGIDRADWLTLPGDARRWPLGPPREIWPIAVSFEKSRDVQQRLLWEAIPRKLWANRYNAERGFPNRVGMLVNGTKFVFKSCEQDLRTFESSRIDLAWIDETIPLRYFLAILPRCVDRQAPILWTTIPDDPLLEDLFLERRFDPATKEVLAAGDVDWVGGTMRDNLGLDRATIDFTERMLLTEEDRSVRIYGRFATGARLVYADFHETLHVRACEPPLTGGQWANRYEVIDPGWAVPCCVLFATLEPGNVYGIYDEIYRKRRTVGEIAAEIFLRRWIWRGLLSPAEIADYSRLTQPLDPEGAELGTAEQIARNREVKQVIDAWKAIWGDLRPRATLVDESAAQRDQAKPVSFVSQLREFGIQARPASNADKRAQQQQVRGLLRPAGGMVRLWISPLCEWTIWEFRHYRDKPPRPALGAHEADREPAQRIGDHAMNCIEYLAAEAPVYTPLGAAEWPADSPAGRHAARVAAAQRGRAWRRRG